MLSNASGRGVACADSVNFAAGLGSSPGEFIPATHSPLQGRAMGGNTLVSGAAVYLYSAGNTAAPGTYGTGATSLLTSTVLTPVAGVVPGGQDSNGNYYVTTNSNGSFSISGDYTCPAAITSGGKSFPSQVYVLVLGGNTGSGENALSAAARTRFTAKPGNMPRIAPLIPLTTSRP